MKRAQILLASSQIIIGTVTDRKAFLSNDKTAVYSEFTVQVEQVLKGQADNLLMPQNTIAVQSSGGAIRFPSGKILRRGNIFERMPLLNKQYLFFLKENIVVIIAAFRPEHLPEKIKEIKYQRRDLNPHALAGNGF